MPINCIVNINQKNIPFVSDPKITIATKGAKSVNCKKQKAKGGLTATAMLAVVLSSIKLPGLGVFAGVRHATVHNECHQTSKMDPNTFLFTVQKMAWCHEEVMLEWIKRIWKPYVEHVGPGPFLLPLDVFSVHQTAKVKLELSKLQTVVLFIPPRATSKAQPLNVGINKPFKSSVIAHQMQQLIQNLDVVIGRHEIAAFMTKAWPKV